MIIFCCPLGFVGLETARPTCVSCAFNCSSAFSLLFNSSLGFSVPQAVFLMNYFLYLSLFSLLLICVLHYLLPHHSLTQLPASGASMVEMLVRGAAPETTKTLSKWLRHQRSFHHTRKAVFFKDSKYRERDLPNPATNTRIKTGYGFNRLAL